ncbi:TORC1 subunit TCO89-domain-containing protein [Morchella snyderi]|nr:TORC1 subunit TCO89-domain-containing protein [Morchella snyderi]
MTEQQRPLFDKRNSSTSSVLSGGNGNDNSNTTTDRDTSSNDEQAQATHQPSRQHHPKKHQFVVGGAHSRHHTRVPSYGRNLNKLGKLAPIATSPGSGKARGEEKGRSSAKRATFELGGDNRQNSNGNSRPGSYKEEGGYTNGNATNTSNGTTPPLTTVATNKGTNGLVKSSSTKSLDRKPRDGARRLKREEKRERSQSKTRDTAEVQPQTQFQLPTPPQAKVQAPPPQHQNQHFQSQHPSHVPTHAPTHLLQHTKVGGAAPPKVSVESVQGTQPTVSAKIRRTTAQQNGAYVTPAHSLPDSHEQPLTSRFIDSSLGNSNSISPSSAAKAYGLSPSYRESLPTIVSTPPDKAPVTPVISSPTPASATATVPSRTQQKLWLQRQSSQHEAPEHFQNQNRMGPGSEWYALQPRAQKEFERVNREYLNTRRFKNPAAQSIERIRDKHAERRIPKRKEGQSVDGAGAMGLSQSLKETGATKSARKELKIGSKDDSGVKQTTTNGKERDRAEGLHSILVKLWNTKEMIPSNE